MKQPDIVGFAVLAIATLLMCFHNSSAAAGIEKYILGGHEAVRGQFPWQVQIATLSGGWWTFCGGSIISRSWILTSAQCHEGQMPTAVYFGSLLHGGQDAEMVVREFGSFTVHEHYVPWHAEDLRPHIAHDIALLELYVSLTWSENIKPVQLPSRLQQHLPEGTKIVSSGWGDVSDGGFVSDKARYKEPLDARTLQYIEFELRDYEVCHQNFFLCSKWYPDRTTHSGDFGGPWVWLDDLGVNRLVGVVARNEKRDNGYYFHAVSVASYLDWIHYHSGIEIDD